MAQPAYPKIDELRTRLRSDPKSRLFFPLAEELRKAGQLAEAERVLRSGLTSHPTYLSAWVSLGRVLRDLGKYADAVDPLAKALQLDPGNVVVARLMAENYYSLGEKVEAIKKYKLVHALLPADDATNAMIERLEMELHPPSVSVGLSEPPEAADSVVTMDESPFDKTMPPFAETSHSWDDRSQEFAEQEAGDFEPMHYAHEESPFQEPVDGYTVSSVELEGPEGIRVIMAPPHANVAETVEARLPSVGDFAEEVLPVETRDESLDVFEETATVAEPEPVFEPPLHDESDVFGLDEETVIEEPAEAAEPESIMPAPAPEEMTNTQTMADLYVRQGLLDDARSVYENILARDPGNEEVRAKLEAIGARSERETDVEAASASAQADKSPARRKIARLERWMAKVSGKEGGKGV